MNLIFIIIMLSLIFILLSFKYRRLSLIAVPVLLCIGFVGCIYFKIISNPFEEVAIGSYLTPNKIKIEESLLNNVEKGYNYQIEFENYPVPFSAEYGGKGTFYYYGKSNPAPYTILKVKETVIDLSQQELKNLDYKIEIPHENLKQIIITQGDTTLKYITEIKGENYLLDIIPEGVVEDEMIIVKVLYLEPIYSGVNNNETN